MRNEKNILLHEFIGLQCEIIASANKSQIGLRGRVVDETMKTIRLDGGKVVAKRGSVFRLTLGEKKLDVSGDFIIARPEDRIKKKTSKW